MDSSNTKKLETLVDLLDKYDDAYYNDDQQLVSDPEYDGIKDETRALFKEFSPKGKAEQKLYDRVDDALSRVGAPPPKSGTRKKVVHEVAMQSLGKSNNATELNSWYNDDCGSYKGKLFVSDKLDGISLDLKYENGTLKRGATRGSGDIGEEITDNVKKMKGVPHQLKEKFTGHVRGEIVLFHSIYKQHLSHMKNVRAGAGGIAKRSDTTDSEHLNVICYTIDGKDYDTEVEAIEGIKALGFDVPNWKLCDTLDDVKKLWQEYTDTKRASLDYDIDGLVVRINDRAAQFALGDKNNRPKGATAFKFDSPEARTVVQDIAVQVGDTGHITPVAIFNAVQLLGAEVKRASLHNFSLVKKLGVDIGATIIVKKCGDVIPYAKSVVKSTGTTFKPPKKCPECGADTAWKGEYLICPNKQSCPAQVKGRLNKWIKELGILEWGESVLTKLIDSGLVKDVADLYRLKAKDIAGLDRMGDRSAQNLIDELDKFRNILLENFVGGLNIDGVATSTTKQVIKKGYDTLDAMRKMSLVQLMAVPTFGGTRASNFYNGLRENAERIDDILAAGVTIKQPIKGKLTGKNGPLSFCFTGPAELPRAKLHQLVKAAGGEVEKNVKRGLDYLVMADADSTSGKAQAARKIGIKLISEEEFMKML